MKWLPAISLVLAGCSTLELPTTNIADPNATPHAVTSASDASTEGLPCDVAQVLTTKCTTCHFEGGKLSPMSLQTYDDFAAYADKIAQRVKAGTMPPSAPLVASEADVLTAWIGAGMPKTQCGGTTVPDRDANVPECALASDCPGNLICRAGLCDVECATSKDCATGETCRNTRCEGPLPEAGPATVTNDITNIAAWKTMTVSGVTAASYSGGTFDGRYVYFAPDGTSGAMLRHDTQAPFDSPRAWASFDVSTLDGTAKAYRGAAFDGRYVYFVPASAAAKMARYDSRGLYLDPASWTLFDLSTVDAAVGFTGATFDGRYLYLAPTGAKATTFRYDTQAPFTTTASWSTFVMTSLNANAWAFAGAVFDGKHVYFVPTGHGDNPHGTVARYDVDAPFATASSWTTLDLATVDSAAVGFRTGTFDGRYLYLVPGWTAPTPTWTRSKVARLDTTAPFGAKDSWSFFDIATVDDRASGYNAAVYDGRSVLFAPGFGQGYHGELARFDATGAFTSPTSWSTFDAQQSFSARNLRGAVSDGHYVYFAPSAGIALRFESGSNRTSLAQPSSY